MYQPEEPIQRYITKVYASSGIEIELPDLMDSGTEFLNTIDYYAEYRCSELNYWVIDEAQALFVIRDSVDNKKYRVHVFDNYLAGLHTIVIAV